MSVDSAERGEATWTDGVTIFVDRRLDLTEQRDAVVIQAALIASKSLEPDFVSALGRRTSLARRYLAVEGNRALSAQWEVLPERYRGLIDFVLAASSGSPAESLEMARNRKSTTAPPPVFGAIHPGRLIRKEQTTSPNDTARVHLPRHELGEPEEFVDDEREDGFDTLSSPVGGGGGLGRLLKKLLADARSTGSGDPGADPVTRWTRQARPTSSSARMSPSRAAAGDTGGLEGTGAGLRYPEWDVARRRYKPEWCTVLEFDPPTKQGTAPTIRDADRIRRALGRVGLEFERRHRSPEGDDIDIDALVESRVNVLLGGPPVDAVYVDTARRRRDLAVLILLDVSGSAGDVGMSGKPVHEHQRDVAATLMQVLHDLGDRVALFGFRSQGRSAVHLMRVKRFDDALDDSTRRRLAALSPGAYTRLGAAIRHGTAVLEHDAGTTRRLLVVISDGFAYDQGYERAYGEGDARRALAESRDRGIGCLCLSVGGKTHAADLRRVFGTAAHAAIDDPAELAPLSNRLFTMALGTAARQQAQSRQRGRSDERLRIERKAS